MDFSKYNSSRFPDIPGSIKDSKKNKYMYGNLTQKINMYDKAILSQGNIFESYRNVLETHLEKVSIDEKYFYRPEWVSLDYYGSTDLWYLILWLNNISRPEYFDKKYIYLLNPNKRVLLNSIIEKFQVTELRTPKYIKNLTLKKI